MPGVLITATGTEVGKTYVTAALLRAGRRAGWPMGALKPVLSGYAPEEAAVSDAGVLLAALGEPATEIGIDAMSPFRFAAPLAPNMAAAAEGRMLDFEALTAACRGALQEGRLTLIEGIGGVMVPLDARHTVLDLVAALALPVVLVTGSALGAISHCLAAFTVLAQRGHAPRLIVLNESAASTVPLDATRETLAAFCGGTPVTILPRDADQGAEDTLLSALIAATDPSRAPQTAA